MFHEEKLNLSGFVHVAQDNIQYEKITNKHDIIETGRVHQVNEENNSKFRSCHGNGEKKKRRHSSKVNFNTPFLFRCC